MSAGDGSAIAHVLVATNLGAVMATLSATVTAWLLLKKPDLSMNPQRLSGRAGGGHGTVRLRVFSPPPP
jgi:ammonia channel protein AmtB